MKGDFSRRYGEADDNFNGVLYQQGRVFLDTDGSAQTCITNAWQDTAGKDLLGAGIAAVPADAPDSFKIDTATLAAGQVTLTVQPGQLWADGWLLRLKGTAPIQRVATYLQPPVVESPAPNESTIDNGVRDAVILEVWREAINGFQLPEQLIEPALGGPDTTERIYTEAAFRLLRLDPGDTCDNLADKLNDNFAQKGKLTVTLQPTTVTNGDCPTVEGGGYTGFEHNLFRIEIAQVNGAAAMFKWSQFNGGLTGRGRIEAAAPDRVIIMANLQAIITSGLGEFYMEVIAFNEPQGRWEVSYGAMVTLNNNNELVLPFIPTFGLRRPAAGTNFFFRLWNAIRSISDFPHGPNPTELLDGIRLAFDADAPGRYVPGDYWTFIVRAGGIPTPHVLIGGVPTLINAQPPEGIHYHRVPLAELHWNAAANANISFEAGQIEDCRKIFRPLTKQRVCCTLLVGDGIQSQGDFNSVEDALRHLPADGGKICLMPGNHHLVNVMINNRKNIQITGCGIHTIVHPHPDQPTAPIFRIEASQGIQLDNLTLMTNTGTAIQVVDPANTQVASQAIYVLRNHIVALTHAVEVRVKNELAGDNNVWIAGNKISMLDKPGGDVAIFCSADDVLIEDNHIVVVPAPDPQRPNDPRKPDDPSVGVFDPCADVRSYYVANFPANQFVHATFQYVAYAVAIAAVHRVLYSAKGGIQVGGGSEHVRIRRNQIIGGSGNGITLGDLPSLGDVDSTFNKRALTYDSLPEQTLNRLQERLVSTLSGIAIEENTIQSMGWAGIGVEAFFNLEKIGLLIRVEDLTVYRNAITRCAQQIPTQLLETMLGDVGFGGIVLTDCENVIIQENRIEHNGVSHVDPICGILILMGENVDVSTNRILDNGPRTSLTNDNIRRGLRGGVVIAMSFRQLWSKLLDDKELLAPDGIPAVKVHNNIVTQPLGQALTILAFGPVSVVGNQLTSQGADFRVNPLSLLAGTVFILNLGVSQDLLAFLLLASYRNLAYINNAMFGADYRASRGDSSRIRKIFYLPSGTVLFTNNQTTLDLRTEERESVFSSQLIASLDDVAYNSNQLTCTSFFDVILTNTSLYAVTVRSNDNRFQEGLSSTLYSLFSYGLVNTATSNQATHCLHVLGNQVIKTDNIELLAYNCKTDYEYIRQVYGTPVREKGTP